MKAAERLRIAYKLAGEMGMDSDKLQSEYAKMVEMIESASDFANAPPPIAQNIAPQPVSNAPTPTITPQTGQSTISAQSPQNTSLLP